MLDGIDTQCRYMTRTEASPRPGVRRPLELSKATFAESHRFSTRAASAPLVMALLRPTSHIEIVSRFQQVRIDLPRPVTHRGSNE